MHNQRSRALKILGTVFEYKIYFKHSDNYIKYVFLRKYNAVLSFLQLILHRNQHPDSNRIARDYIVDSQYMMQKTDGCRYYLRISYL